MRWLACLKIDLIPTNPFNRLIMGHGTLQEVENWKQLDLKEKKQQ